MNRDEARNRIAYAKAIFDKVSIQDIQDIVSTLIDSAKAGDVKAAKEVLDRTAGPVAQALTLQGNKENPVTIEVMQDIPEEQLIEIMAAIVNEHKNDSEELLP